MIEYTPEDKVDNARMDLVLNFPFFGSVFLQLNVFEDPDCKTAWTDGRSIGYNLDYIAKLEHEVIIGLFVHECLHVILKHHLRQWDNQDFMDNHMKYNVAADYALNPIIKGTKGMDISPTWMYNQKWEDSLAEIIFYELGPEDMPDGDDGDSLPGEVRPFQGDPGKAAPGRTQPTQAELDIEGQKIDQWVRSAAFKAQGAGKLTGGNRELVKVATAPTVCWQDELTFLCEEVTKNNYTWVKPNQRYMQFGAYLPSMNGHTTVDMIFYVDVSGSLSDAQLSKIAAEIQVIVSSFDIRVIVVYWDTQYKGMEVFDKYDVMEPEWGLDVTGRGGTDFTDCWDWMFDNQDELEFDPKAIVFFSDLECTNYPDLDPDLPLLWCQIPCYCQGITPRFIDSYLNYLPDYGRHVRVPIYRDNNEEV